MPDIHHKTESDGDQLDKVSWELLGTYEALSTIYRSADLLAQTAGTVHAAGITLECAVEVTESCGGVLLVSLNGEMNCLAAVNGEEEIVRAAREALGHYGSKPHYEDGDKGPRGRYRAANGCSVQSSLYVPFTVASSDQKGLIYLFYTHPREYTSIDVKQVEILCRQGAFAIQCFRQMEELREKNLKLRKTLDELTSTQGELLKSERLSTLGKVASMIIHDIKNPMSGLMGYAQLMESMAGDLTAEEIQEYTGIIIKEMQRLSYMTEEILEFSRGTETKLNLRGLTSRDLVTFAAPVIEAQLSSSGVAFNWDDLDEERILFADSDKMERVFINLAVNAQGAMDEGGVFSISTFVEGDWMEFILKDTGKGVPPEIKGRIFEPFFSNKKSGGLGIGLSVARWVVEAHGGRIWLDHTGLDGTEFRIRLPLQPCSDEEDPLDYPC